MPFRLFLTALAALMMPVGSPGAESPPSLKKDVAYVENGHARQKLDLRLPADPKGAPVVLWIHGGGWVTGGKENPPIAALTEKSLTFAKAKQLFGDKGAMDLVAVMSTYAVSGFYAIAVDEHVPADKPQLPR